MSASVRAYLDPSRPEFLSRLFDHNRPGTAHAPRALSPVKVHQKMCESPPSSPEFPGFLYYEPVITAARERARGLPQDHPPDLLDINNNEAAPHYKHLRPA